MSTITETSITIAPKPPVPLKKPNLKFNRLIYAKYRDMLKSYNHTLPSTAILQIDYGLQLNEKDLM